MLILQIELEMRRHGSPFISAGLENDRRPELRNLRNMMIPVMHGLRKDRPEQLVLPRSSIKCGHQFLNGSDVYRWMRLVDEKGHGKAFGVVPAGYRRSSPAYPAQLCRMLVLFLEAAFIIAVTLIVLFERKWWQPALAADRPKLVGRRELIGGIQ